MSSVTEQMLIHAQEFNVRLDRTEDLIHQIHEEVIRKLIGIQDVMDLIDFRLKEMNDGR